MQVHRPSRDPTECARALDDTRLRKAIIEAARILSTAAHARGYTFPAQYKTSGLYHPLVLYCAENSAQYKHILQYFCCLTREYAFRFRKEHKSTELIRGMCQTYASLHREDKRQDPLREVPNTTQHKNMDTLDAHKYALFQRWMQHLQQGKKPQWTRRGPPSWLKHYGLTQEMLDDKS